MASMRDIKRRKESVQSTSQITKAMKLVSTVKLQHAKEKAEESKPYFDKMYQTVTEMLSGKAELPASWVRDDQAGASGKKGIVLISSNRGLAGGYNSNIAKKVMNDVFTPDNTLIFPVGRKGLESLKSKGYNFRGDFSEVINKPLYSDAIQIGKEVMSAYEMNEIDEIYLAYTVFKNTMTQIPTLIRLFPFTEEDLEDFQEEGLEQTGNLPDKTIMNYEPDEEESLEVILPMYLNSIIYGALMESLASEHGARMQAMDSATKNAEEMIDDLELRYNRARQGEEAKHCEHS